MANSDGIIVIKRAEGLRNTSRKARKMTLAVSAKLCGERGQQALRDLRAEHSFADHLAVHGAQRRLTRPAPRPMLRSTNVRIAPDSAEELRACRGR